MLFFCDLHRSALPAVSAELLKLTKICFLGLEDTNSACASTALCATSPVDGFLSTWHSRDTLLGDPQERKSKKDEGKTDDLGA